MTHSNSAVKDTARNCPASKDLAHSAESFAGSKAYRLLVADDNPALSSVLKFNLERSGYRVTVAATGRQAYELAQTKQFDLVITDQQMPEMTGLELTQRLREMENYRDIPIFMLTAKGLELELPRLREELCIAGLFLKPFSPKEITQAVDKTLANVR